MAYNIADLFEHTADMVPDRPALVDGDDSYTFAELDARANQIAHHLAAQGVGLGDHVGIYGYNSHGWVEAMYACFKVRAIPINVNFRYVTDELAYIFQNADLVAAVVDRQFVPTMAEILDKAPRLTSAIVIDDGSGADLSGLDSIAVTDYEDIIAKESPERDFPERSGDDLYVLYTGGTTGMPKGVMWRQEDVFMALGQGIDALTGIKVSTEWDQAHKARDSENPVVFLVIPPLMHGAAQWATMGQMLQGNTIVLLPKFDAEEAWRLVQDRKCNAALITGDAMARPMIEWLDEHPDRFDVSSFVSISSSAAIFSATVKDRYLDHFPTLFITDSIGSTESGFNGLAMASKGTAQKGGGPTVAPGPDMVILDDDLNIIPPDDDTIGKIGRGGNIPLGYFNDPAKTAETFVTAADGKRYAVPGDFARWESDGTITLLGRGSVSINSGGEKIYPEEVEQALKDHPAVFDCIVVGVPDERWGQRVTVVVQFRDGHTAELEHLADHARQFVAGYKVPREMFVVELIQRSPSGKPDYPWAQKLARGEA